MITVHNFQLIENQPFEEYLQLKRISHSTITGSERPFKPSAKIHLGSQVDAYLNEPDRFEGDIKLVKSLATCLMAEVKDLYPRLIKQATILADFEYMGMIMPYKGRPDWCIPGLIVIDIKVAENVEHTMHHFGYPNQLSGYCIPLNLDRWIILAVSSKKMDPKTGMNRITKKWDKVDHQWWERQVMRFGHPIKSYI